MAEYHAAAWAVGGCAIYVSDKPENHDFDLLRKLVFPDGSILRAKLPERQTALSLLQKFRAMEASRACWYFLARSPTSSTSSPTTTTPRTRSLPAPSCSFICPAQSYIPTATVAVEIEMLPSSCFCLSIESNCPENE
uniref:Uncharacterized protein n=1 Tax=Triticum urartu TaxID=4572 RepID=A0A8R7Q1R8_TRIUA